MDAVATSMRRSLPRDTKAIDRLSGDQNTSSGESVPGSGRTALDARSRTQTRDLPPTMAVNASVLPLGDSARKSPRMVPSGRTIEDSIRAEATVADRRVPEKTMATRTEAAAIVQGSHLRR